MLIFCTCEKIAIEKKRVRTVARESHDTVEQSRAHDYIQQKTKTEKVYMTKKITHAEEWNDMAMALSRRKEQGTNLRLSTPRSETKQFEAHQIPGETKPWG